MEGQDESEGEVKAFLYTLCFCFKSKKVSSFAPESQRK